MKKIHLISCTLFNQKQNDVSMAENLEPRLCNVPLWSYHQNIKPNLQDLKQPER